MSLTLFCTSVAISWYGWLLIRDTGSLLVAGLYLGFALSDKLNALVFLVPVGLAALGAAIWSHRDAPLRHDFTRWLAVSRHSPSRVLHGRSCALHRQVTPSLLS